MVAPRTYRDLDEDEKTERGDEVSFDSGHTWEPVYFVNRPANGGINRLRYRRPIPVQQQTTDFAATMGHGINCTCLQGIFPCVFHFRDNEAVVDKLRGEKAAVTPTTLESDRLRAVIAKESEHRGIVEANTIGRDRAVDLGRELQLLRNNFARAFPDRLFIADDRVVSTDDGRYEARSAEVVS